MHTKVTTLRLASSSCILHRAEHSQSSKPPSRKACRPHTRTWFNVQQQHSSGQHHSTSLRNKSHQPQGSDQHRAIGQQQGPDISLLSPRLQHQWDHARNAHLGNILIKRHSNRKVWWQCGQCPDGHPHVWEARLTDRSRGSSCPFCTSQRVCQHNSLASKHPDVAAEFSDRNQGTAHDFTAGSGEEVVWQCKHGHEYIAAIHQRTSKNSGCPDCFAIRQSSQPQQQHPVLVDSPHPVMHLWDIELNAKEDLDPHTLKCRSTKTCHWVCHCCPKGRPHRWQAPAYRVCLGSGCPCCSSRKVCICNSLQSLFPEVAAEWDYTCNTGTPNDYPAGSGSKVWWYNDKRGSFQTQIRHQTCVRKQLP